MEEFDDEDCVEAEKLFEEVRRQFPYSKYAPSAATARPSSTDHRRRRPSPCAGRRASR